MIDTMTNFTAKALLLATAIALCSVNAMSEIQPLRPNIILILADDLGYGDLACYNSRSKIPTPNLDRLAAEGMRFTDAHATAAVCTPSRYNLLTGRYAWRSRLKKAVLFEYDGPLIEPGRQTLPGILRDAGYHTAMFGKWHLGWDWTLTTGERVNDLVPYGKWADPVREGIGRKVDFTVRLGGGPLDCGFTEHFGVDVPNFPPYTWIEGDRITEQPTAYKAKADRDGTAGPTIPGWDSASMIPAFQKRSLALIERSAKTNQPFFLYHALTSPHSPISPNKEFIGKSGLDRYGDFVVEIDHLVGEIVDALERTGQVDNTILIFASDNGPEGPTPDNVGAYERARTTRHFSSGDLRGVKRDAWEGGHRIPLIAHWPGVIPTGASNDHLVLLGDLMATVADITGATIHPGEAEDSQSFWATLRDPAKPARASAVLHSVNGKFVLRKGDWVLIDAPTGDDNYGEYMEPEWLKKERGYTAHNHPGELFNVREDPSSRTNRYADHPELVAEFKSLLEQAKAGRIVERPSFAPGEKISE
jgi:arylsulfatase A-like enzyme